jgi:hypothetical protein
MQSLITFQGLPIDIFWERMAELIRREAEDACKAAQLQLQQEKFLSPTETCSLFQPKISKSTLNAWTSKGILKSYRLGGKVFYKLSEILESLSSVKRYNRNTSPASSSPANGAIISLRHPKAGTAKH